MPQESNLTFNEITGNLPWIKVVWNGQVVYDDTIDANRATIDDYNYVQKHLGDKKVYSMKIVVVQYHHCELYVEGEEDDELYYYIPDFSEELDAEILPFESEE